MHAPAHTTHPAAHPAAATVLIHWAELSEHRSFLVRFAARRLADPLLAEDLVHDVFEAVMTGRAVFSGRASLRSWLVAVLKHKIVDLIRERSAQYSLDAMQEGSSEDDGSGIEFKSDQPGPAEQVEQRELLVQAMAGIRALPPTLRQAFELRVLGEHSTEDVCGMLGISSENLFVRLHRARRQLLAS